jgi:DHA2 family multidrug resistance protein
LLEIVDTTIVNVALTNMRGSLGATLTDVAWVITAYAIANVIVILPVGSHSNLEDEIILPFQ